MANPDEDVDKKVEDVDNEEVEDDDKENVEDVDKEEGEDSDADSLDERINPAPGFEDYNFPEDPEKWTVEDLGEVWIHEKLSETEDSDDEIIDDTESSSEDTDDVSTDISGLTSEEEDEEEEEEEEEEEGGGGGGGGERGGEGGGGGGGGEEEVGVGGGGEEEEEEEEEEEYDDDLDDFTSDDDISYISSSDDEPSDPWLKFQKRNDPHGYEEKDLNEGFGWDPDMAGNESKKAKRIDDITEEDFEEFYFDDEDDDDEPNYVPYHRTFPVVPVNWYEVSDEHEVVEELDRIEEALVWFSFVFDDGCTYEGTIWDDLAQGKGVFTTPLEICRYEGEWHQNMMEGHGVLEVDIPDEEPAPDSELAEEMRKQGKILKADYMSPEDREWLIKDINDSELKTHRMHQIYDNPEWIEYFGEMPERGHYRYAGQWKHGRMHGCGVYEVNRRLVWGRFYFGDMESDPEECTAEISAMHASLAEVAAAKARMFVNKPDGMVRELKGPYSDPQHPYMYDEEDVWMAPGFINQFYEVPEVWQRYVHDVDQERQMWLDSYYKSPLRIPMPAELEKWWWDDPEFLVISDIKDPDREVLIHLPTNRLINWTQDPEGHVRLFWDETGENKPDESFLPLDFDEFVGEEEKARIEEAKLKTALEEKVREKTGELQQKLGKKKNNEEEKRNRVDLEFRFLKVQEETEVLLDDVENQVDNKHVCEETVEIKAQEKEPKDTPGPEDSEGGPSQDYEEEEEEDDEDEKPRSFGTVASAESQCDQRNSDRKMDNRGPSTPPTLFASLSMVSMVAMRQLNPLTSWLKRKQHGSSKVDSPFMEGLGYAIRKQENSSGLALTDCPKFINYPLSRNRAVRLKAGKSDQKLSCRNTNFLVPCTELGFSCHVLSHTWNCLSKPNKSYGRKKCQGNEKREQKPRRKYSNKQEKIALIFSLSIPVEELG